MASYLGIKLERKTWLYRPTWWRYAN